MDALERAKHLIKAANEADERADYEATVREAQALAAIATAEAAQRQAAAMERIADALHHTYSDGSVATLAKLLSRTQYD